MEALVIYIAVGIVVAHIVFLFCLFFFGREHSTVDQTEELQKTIIERVTDSNRLIYHFFKDIWKGKTQNQ